MYIKIVDGVIVQKQCNPEAGFVEAPEGVVCGMIQDGANFINPQPHTPSSPTEMKMKIEDHCSNMFSAGLVYEAKTFQMCGKSQQKIASRATYAALHKIDAVAFPWIAPYSNGWWDVNDAVLASTQTADGFLAFAKAASNYCSACDKCCRDHKSAVTVENCTTYNYSTGWPV